MKRIILLCAIVSLIFSSGQSQAGWIQSLGQSERCISMGGACVAKADDYAAFYHNPAAATFDKVVIGGNLRLLDTTHVDLIDSAGNHSIDGTNTEGDIVYAPTLAGYIPISDNITFGIGFGAPFAITADWNNDDGIHRFSMSDQSLFVMDLTPTLAFKINDKLSFGIGLNIIVLKQLQIESLLPNSFGAALPPSLGGIGTVIPTTPDSPVMGSISLGTEGDVDMGIPPGDMDTSFDEYSITLGVQYKVSDRLNIGAVYRSKVDMSWKGDLTLDLSPAGMGVQTVGYNLEMDMPAHLQVGFAYDLIPNNLSVSMDLQKTFWSKADGLGTETIIRLDTPLLGFVNDLEVDYNAHDTLTARFGLEYRLNKHWSLLAGYAFDESIFDNQHVDILVYDSDRNIFSLGVSYETTTNNNEPDWNFHFGVQVTDYKKRTIAAGESQNLGGFSLPNLLDQDTLSFSENRDEFQYGGAILALGLSVQRSF